MKIVGNKLLVFLIILMVIVISFIHAQVLAQEIVINEIMSSNQEFIQDSDSDFDDWLELKNIGDKPVNLSGYYLSDKADNLTRWQFNPDKDFIIQPDDYLLIWADDEIEEGELHTNFKLSSSGETLTLTEADGNKIVDQIKFPKIMTDVSYGRKSNNTSKWVYFISPTPEKSNTTFGISSYYWTEKIKFLSKNKFLSAFFFLTFIIIFVLLISYYKINNKLGHSKVKYEKLFEESPIGLIRVDIKGNILDVNKRMVELLGAPDKKAIKKFNLNNVENIKEIWNRKVLSSDNKNDISGEFEYTTHWNKKVFLKYKIAVISSKNKIIELILAANDISREKEIENKLKYLSFHDELTGLYNRRYFENELERLNQSRKLPISIIIADLDNLKQTNDIYGHKTGDKYIIKAADIIQNNFRDEDIVARIGGDEFAAILPDTNLKTASEISKRIKSSCREVSNYKNFGLSIGCASKDENNTDLEEVFIKADKELYKDKKS